MPPILNPFAGTDHARCDSIDRRLTRDLEREGGYTDRKPLPLSGEGVLVRRFGKAGGK